MAVDIATIGVGFDTSGLKAGQAELAKTERAAGKTADAADKTSKGFAALSSAAKMAAGVLAGIGVGTVINNYIRLADTVTLIDARLRLATKGGAEFAQAQQDIFRISQQNSVGLSETASLYTKLSDPIRALGGNMGQVAAITEAFATSLKVSGASTAEASAATLQFAQAMGAGALRGDEFNSIAEANPRLMKALAAGIGVGTGELREMAQAGQLTADVVGNALMGQLETLRREGESIPLTVGAAMQQLANTALVLVGDFDKVTGASGSIAEMMVNVLTPAMKSVFSVAVGVATAFQTVGKIIGGVAALIGQNITGMAEVISRVMAGDFAGAWEQAKNNVTSVGNIVGDVAADISATWERAGGAINGAWNQTNESANKASQSVGKLNAAVGQTTKNSKEAAAAVKKAADEYNAWMAKMAADEDAYRQKLFQARLQEQEQEEKAHSDWLKQMADDEDEYRQRLFNDRMDEEEKAQKDLQDEYKKQVDKEEKAHVDMWKSIDETARSVFTDVANEGEDAFERIGKTLKAAILDMLYQMTVRKWIFQIAGVDVGGMGGGGSSMGSLARNAMGQGGMYGSNLIGNYIGGGNIGAAYGYASGTMSYANAAGSIYANATGGGIDALLATNGAYGTATQTAVAGAAAEGAATGAAAGASGASAAAVLGWAALIIALWEPLFGRKTRGIGLAGNFDGAGGIATSRYTEQSGGLFRSDKTTYEPLNDQGAFQKQLKGIQDGMIETARVMGLGEDAIKNFSGSVNINLKGLNAEEAAAKTKEEFTKLQAQMLATASYTPEVTKSFEEIEAAALEMGMSAEDAAQHAREVTARDDALKRQGFESMTNYYIDLINQTEAAMARAGITSEALADIITQGMTGRMDQSQVGAALADIVLGGIYNTIAGGFAKQISDVFMQQIIQPIMMAVTAGVPLTTAISQQAMATVVAQAQQSASILKAIFDDPIFQQTMRDLQSTIGGISSAVVKPARSIRAFGSAALAAGNAARQAADQIARERYGLETRLLELQGNTVELRRRELLQLHPSNRALQQQIWALEDQQKAAEEAARAAEELRNEWESMVDSMIEEVKRLRGEVIGDSPGGLAYLQAQFATATAAARAGDKNAAESLPELSRRIAELAEEQVTSLLDLNRIRGGLASSLEETARRLAEKFGLDVTDFGDGVQLPTTPSTVTITSLPAVKLDIDKDLVFMAAQIGTLTESNRVMARDIATMTRVLRQVTNDGQAMTTEPA